MTDQDLFDGKYLSFKLNNRVNIGRITKLLKRRILFETSVELGNAVELELIMSTEKGRYSFSTRVVGREGNLYLLNMLTEIKPLQERNDVRVNTIIDVYITKETSSANNRPLLKALTVNLSAGGLKVVTERQYELETMINLRFNLQENIEVKGKVVWCIKAQRGLFYVALKYCDVSSATKDKIFKFVLNTAIDQRKKQKFIL